MNIRILPFLFIFFFVVVPTKSWAGSIKGVIKYEGEAPKFRPIKMEADPVCLTKHTEPVYPQTLVLGEGNSMANVFVHVTNGLPKKNYPPPQEPAVLDQKGCEYSPHVLGVMVGQTVKILNPDGTLHNVHALSKTNAEFNLAMPKFRQEVTKVFDKEEAMFPMKCDVHPWMGAWISVLSHPYFDTTGKDGSYQIDNLPDGTYELTAWHEKLGTQKATVTVKGDEQQVIDFTFSRPATP
jgi:plastocyanin